MSVSVCLSARVCPNVQISRNFLCVLTVAVARSSFDDSAIRYVYYSFGVVDDVILPMAYILSESPGAAPGRSLIKVKVKVGFRFLYIALLTR